MSRIGNKEIEVLNDVKVDFNDGLLKVVGPKGNLQRPIPEGVKLDITDGKIKVSRLSEDKKVKALHGLVRSLINNMVIGVSQGFEKSLEIIQGSQE